MKPARPEKCCQSQDGFQASVRGKKVSRRDLAAIFSWGVRASILLESTGKAGIYTATETG
jgi:hypothetical protein